MLRLRAPLLWLVLPLAAGIALARCVPLQDPLMPALGGLALAAGAGWLVTRRGRWAGIPWGVCVLGAALLLGWSHASMRLLPRLEDWHRLPPRELTCTLRIEQAFTPDQWGRARGLGRIEAPPALLAELAGQRVLYRIGVDEPLPEGTRLPVKGVVRRLPAAAGEGSFDAFLQSREVYFELSRAHATGTAVPPPLWRRWAAATCEWAAGVLVAGSDRRPELRALLPAMLLGERRLLDDAQMALFRSTGMLHLFAVSGLHVGLVALTLNALLQACRVPQRTRAVAGLALLLGYVLVIGAPPSAVRAFLMVLFYWGGRAFMRQAGVFPALVASALAVLAWHPAQLFDAGAQLSYGIVAGITLYGLPLAAEMRQQFSLFAGLPREDWTLPHRIAEAVMVRLYDYMGVAAGAFVVSVPLSLHYFGVFAPGGLLLNLLLAPLALLAVVSACLALLAAALAQVPVLGLFTGLWMLFTRAGWMSCALMQWTIEALGGVPGLFTTVQPAAPWQGIVLAIGMLLMAGLLRFRSVRYARNTIRFAWHCAPFVTVCVAMVLLQAMSTAG